MIEPNYSGTRSATLSRPLSIFILIISLLGFNVFRWNQYLPGFLQPFGNPKEAASTASTTVTKVQLQRRDVDGLSLVTSFWAEKIDADATTPTKHVHRREIEAAMLVNLQNPHLRQVVVILDSVNENTTDCAGFVDYMTRKLDSININRSLPLFASASIEHATLPQLECIERRGQNSGQPTYFEMFHYATLHPSITSDKVVMTNADQVFDESLAFAKNLSKNIIFVLATYGFNPDTIPPEIREQYLALVGSEYANAKTKSWCYGNWMKTGWSWDTYIFHRSLLVDTLQAAKNFTRLNFSRVPTAYYMNEDGAEYAALHDITQYLLGKATVWNACLLIRMWHFHLTSKMHPVQARWSQMPAIRGGGYIFYEDYGPVRPKDGKSITIHSNQTTNVWNKPGGRVPTPSAFARYCVNETTCNAENPLNETVFPSAPQRDATQVRAMLINTSTSTTSTPNTGSDGAV